MHLMGYPGTFQYVFYGKMLLTPSTMSFINKSGYGCYQARQKDSRARGANRRKRAPTTLGQQMYPRNGGHLRHFFGNIMGYASHSHINDCLFQSNIAFFSLYDLCCIILTTEMQIIAFKKGTFAPPALPTGRHEGCLLPLPPSPVCLAAIINQLQNDHFKRMVRNE